MAVDRSFDLVKSLGGLLDKHYLGARYPSALPGGVPAEAFDGQDSGRALEIAREVLRFVRERLSDPST
jgi:HEPN domain-containing protein